MKRDRKIVFSAIDSERDYQDSLWPEKHDPSVANQMSIGDFILLIEEYASRARKDWTEEYAPEMDALNGIRKIAGIAVNCMEQHGAPQREGFER